MKQLLSPLLKRAAQSPGVKRATPLPHLSRVSSSGRQSQSEPMTDGLVSQRAALKSAKQALQVSKSLNVVRFVGVPLPGTGAWTGAMAWDPRREMRGFEPFGPSSACRETEEGR